MKQRAARRIMPSLKAAAFIIALIVLWQILATIGGVNETLFPGPLKVANAMIGLYFSGQLINDTLISTWRLFAGLIIGSLFGIFFGALMGRILFLEEAIAPTIHILRAFPPVAIIPLLIVWLGIGDAAKIFAIAFAVFFPVWISSLIGAKSVHSDFIKTAKIFSKKPVETFSKIVLPSAAPFIINGIRIGISIAFIMVFVSELAGASEGLGYLIAFAQITYRIDNMIAGLIVLGLLAATTDYLFTRFSNQLFPWVNQNG